MIRINETVYKNIIYTIGSKEPETGGIIGQKDKVICAFYYDQAGVCDNNTYTPDIYSVNNTIAMWSEKAIQFAGMIHSHRETCEELSCADVHYAQMIMQANDMESILFPLVIANQKRIIFYEVVIDGTVGMRDYEIIHDKGNGLEAIGKKIRTVGTVETR